MYSYLGTHTDPDRAAPLSGERTIGTGPGSAGGGSRQAGGYGAVNNHGPTQTGATVEGMRLVAIPNDRTHDLPRGICFLRFLLAYYICAST